MNKLIIPLVGAVVAGLAGGSAFSFVNAKAEAKVIAAHVADSLAKHAHDSTAVADSIAKEEHARQVAAAAEEIPLTPADSIRLAQNQPTTLSAATEGLPNAADPAHGTPASHAAAPAANSHAAPAASKPAPATNTAAITHAAAVPPKTATPPKTVAGAPAKAAGTPTTEVAHAPETKAPAALESALPERRIAKIFGAMQSKDAAKVLEQMSDNDVRVILGMMGDKQAAAILTALPVARAAAISKGELAKPAAKDEKKPAGGHP